jgi:ABC-type cobalamin/Fe3+-siderophores transport system ATPase subunit
MGASDCMKTIIKVLRLYPTYQLIGTICIPILSVCMNKVLSNLLDAPETAREFWLCVSIKLIADVLSILLQQELLWQSARNMKNNLQERLEQANIYCGIPLPGQVEIAIQDLLDDSSKLQDFLMVIPIIWTTIVSFGLMMLLQESHSAYPLKSTQFVSICTLTYLMTKNVDHTVYERIKPMPRSIVHFRNRMSVWFKLSIGCSMLCDFEKLRMNRMNKQHRFQRVVIIALNLITTVIALLNNDIKMINSFGNISWLLGCLSDNIKSLQYYTYMDTLFSTLILLEKNKLMTGSKTLESDLIDTVVFQNAQFGYFVDDALTKMDIKIKNFSMMFQKGIVYYLEAENGIGKSTLLKMFSSNLSSGNIWFGSVNRTALTFDCQRRSVIHYVQSSEYTPNLTREEMEPYRSKDADLENILGLDEIWGKGMSEISGGMKKRFMIYMALISSAPIVLLDETLTELSSQSELGRDNGWLGVVLKTLISCEKSKNKIIFLIGHDLLHRIPSEVIKLRMQQTEDKTSLDYF